ncbi:phosphoinositide phosphatase [Haematococcus lacustris]
MPSFLRVSPHLALSVYTSGSQVLVQPKGERGAAVSTLSVNLASGSAQHLTVPSESGPALEVLGVMGLCKLHSGSALLLITAARKVGMLEGADLFLVTQTKVLAAPSAKLNSANRSLLSLLEEAVHPCGAGRGLYFSYFHDLTLTTQRAASLRVSDPAAFAAQLPVERADSRFFWNKVAAAPLIKAGAARFVQPCILGFVQQLPGLQLKDQAAHGNPVTASLTLIARRSTARSGVRQWRRGADAEGNVANFAETEQILAIEGPSNSPLAGALCSYLILRGSIPLLWTQLPNIKYKPSTLIAPAELSSPAHDKHFHALVEQYKGVVAINLINHHGTEGKLEVAFRSEAARLTSSASAIARAVRYIAFDFHAECGNKRYHRLSLLWDQISADFTAQGFLRVDPASGAVARQQGGVVRVNCIDCLDRTNVVQGVLARKSLEAMLASLGLLPSTREGHLATLPEAYPEVEREFKILWADHGDALSTQYAGTGAMKSGFTRTGKRTTAGALDDGVKAVVRYYLNNYQDGRKQDALDLLTGAYQPDGVRPPPLRPQPSPLVPLLLGLLGMSIALYNLVQLGWQCGQVLARRDGAAA